VIGDRQFKLHVVVRFTEIWLPYGLSEVPVRIPDENLVDILQPRQPEEPSKIDFENIASDDLIAGAKSSDRVCIVVGESRSNEAATNAVNFLINRLTRSGVALSSLTVLHSVKSAAIDAIPSEVQVVNHSPHTSPMTQVSRSADFEPSINSLVAGNTLTIVVGELRMNHVLGLSGLCDTIFPGLASERSAQDQLIRSKPMDPHDLITERLGVASSLRNIYGLGFVLNSELAPIEITLDKFPEAVAKLGEVIRSAFTVQASRSANIVVMSAGGMPVDESLLTAVESFPAGMAVLKRNGALIVAAECSAGHGDTDFYAWAREQKEARHLETRLRHRFNYYGWKAAYLMRALNSHRIYLVSTIPDHHLEHTFGLRPAKTINAALQSAQRALGSDASILVIPSASQVIPTIATATQETAKESAATPERKADDK
jgi:nickel-dependent lactate racemase